MYLTTIVRRKTQVQVMQPCLEILLVVVRPAVVHLTQAQAVFHYQSVTDSSVAQSIVDQWNPNSSVQIQ